MGSAANPIKKTARRPHSGASRPAINATGTITSCAPTMHTAMQREAARGCPTESS